MWKQKLHITGARDGSPARELAVCRNAILRIKKSLELLEQKHRKTTERFMEEFHSGSLAEDPDLKEDYDAWISSCDSLQQWQELESRLRGVQDQQ